MIQNVVKLHQQDVITAVRDTAPTIVVVTVGVNAKLAIETAHIIHARQEQP